jgi:hypothetical protein
MDRLMAHSNRVQTMQGHRAMQIVKSEQAAADVIAMHAPPQRQECCKMALMQTRHRHPQPTLWHPIGLTLATATFSQQPRPQTQMLNPNKR